MYFKLSSIKQNQIIIISGGCDVTLTTGVMMQKKSAVHNRNKLHFQI